MTSHRKFLYQPILELKCLSLFYGTIGVQTSSPTQIAGYHFFESTIPIFHEIHPSSIPSGPHLYGLAQDVGVTSVKDGQDGGSEEFTASSTQLNLWKEEE